MINLQPLIEKFKKAVYGRDVRQSIVDLAQAIGDNHNEQEGLRDEVRSLDSDIKVKKEEAEQAINIAISSVNSAKTEAEKSISSGINALNSGKEEIENKTNSKIQYLEKKTESLKKQIISTAENKMSDVNQTIDSANESNRILKETIQQSTNERKNLDGSIQQGRSMDSELESHIAEIDQIIADGKAVTKEELSEELKNKLSNYPTLEQVKPEIIAINCGGFMWYVQIEPITFINAPDTTEIIKTRRIKAYCHFKLYKFKDKVKRDENNPDQASLEVSGWSDSSSVGGIGFSRAFNRYASFEIQGPKAKNIIWKELQLGQFTLNLNWKIPNGEAEEKRLHFIIKAETFI